MGKSYLKKPPNPPTKALASWNPKQSETERQLKRLNYEKSLKVSKGQGKLLMIPTWNDELRKWVSWLWLIYGFYSSDWSPCGFKPHMAAAWRHLCLLDHLWKWPIFLLQLCRNIKNGPLKSCMFKENEIYAANKTMIGIGCEAVCDLYVWNLLTLAKTMWPYHIFLGVYQALLDDFRSRLCRGKMKLRVDVLTPYKTCLENDKNFIGFKLSVIVLTYVTCS